MSVNSYLSVCMYLSVCVGISLCVYVHDRLIYKYYILRIYLYITFLNTGSFMAVAMVPYIYVKSIHTKHRVKSMCW